MSTWFQQKTSPLRFPNKSADQEYKLEIKIEP